MGTKTAREHIAIGEKVSFTYPPPVGFVKDRATILTGATIVSAPVRIDKQLNIGTAITVILKDDAGNALYDLDYRELVYSEGIDNSNAQYLGQIFGPWKAVVAGATALVDEYIIGSLTFPSTQAIEVRLKNNGANAHAVKVNPLVPGDLGRGLHVRVASRSQP